MRCCQVHLYSENGILQTSLSGGFWTDEDLTELIRLVKKYPAGLSNRWVVISETMNRTVQEVTFMAAKMKENGYRLPGQTDSVAENIVQETREIVKKEKTKQDKSIVIPETNWTQEQQKALEAAIVKYRKTAGSDRWQKIANCVPDKTKEECLVRYKYLCELVKSQKRTEESENNEANSEQQLIPHEIPETVIESPPEVAQVVTAEDFADELSEKGGKKRNKRKERRRRRDLSSDEDSDDAYTYEIN